VRVCRSVRVVPPFVKMSQPAGPVPKKKLQDKKIKSEAGKERYLKISREDGIQTDTEIGRPSASLEHTKARRKKSVRSKDDRPDDVSSQPENDDTEPYLSEADGMRYQGSFPCYVLRSPIFRRGYRKRHLCCAPLNLRYQISTLCRHKLSVNPPLNFIMHENVRQSERCGLLFGFGAQQSNSLLVCHVQHRP
jgi:hypothetical protein